MTLRLVLTDGAGVQGLTGTFGAIVQTNVIQTAADAAAAATSAANAATSASSASGSAAAAATSAANAATQATNAANSATAASGSASSAAGSATAANTSATNAATSASSASGSATAASTSATNAANSATAAATSASNAAATLANALTKANNLSDVASAVTALANLNGAKRGANSDITSLSGLSTALSIAQGGTGATSAAAALTALGTQPTSNPTFTGNVGVPTRTAGDSTANAATTAFVAAALAPMVGKNRIINPSQTVDQRNSGAAQTITAGAALAYTVDRWYAYCTGANVTGQQGTRSYVLSGAASVTAIGYGQRIESRNISDLAGQTVTLGVDLANSLLTTVNWTAYYANTVDSFGTLASPTRTQIATGSFTVNSSRTRYSAQIALPANAANGVEIVFTVGAQTSGTWTIGDVQIEGGSIATPIERRLHGLELMLCYRYFYWTFNQQGAPVSVGTAFSASVGGFVFITPVPMRANATVTPVNIYAINAGGSTGFLVGGLTAGATTQGFQIYWFNFTSVASNPLVAGNAVLIEIGLSTGPITGSITFSAEL